MLDINSLVNKKLAKSRLKLSHLGIDFQTIYPFEEAKKAKNGSLILVTDGKKILKVEEYKNESKI